MTLSPRSNSPGRMHWTRPFAVEAESVFRLKLILRKVAGPDPVISAGLICFTDGALNNGAHPDAFARALLSQATVTSLTDLSYEIDVPVGNGLTDIRPGTDQVYLAIEMENQAEFKLTYFGAENISQAFDLQSQIAELETDYNNNKASVSASLLAFSDETDALAASNLALQSDVSDNAAAISLEVTTRANETLALTNQLNTFTSQTNASLATVSSETATLTTDLQALGLRVDSTESGIAGVSASTSILQASVADLEGNAASSIILRASAGNPAILELASASSPNGSVSTGTFSGDYLTLGTVRAFHLLDGTLYNLAFNTSSTFTAVTTNTVLPTSESFTSVGRKVVIDIKCDCQLLTGSDNTLTDNPSVDFTLGLYRDGSFVKQFTLGSLTWDRGSRGSLASQGPSISCAVGTVDQPSAGTYSYTLKGTATILNGGGSGAGLISRINNVDLMITEIDN